VEERVTVEVEKATVAAVTVAAVTFG